MSGHVRCAGLLTWAAALLLGDASWAGSNGYFVTYDSKVQRGEIELMFMHDITAPCQIRREEEGFGDYLSHMIELEYGLTDQWASEFMIEWFEDLDTSERRFTGFRWENRYRLFRNDVPLNPMAYAEYEDLDPATRYKMEVSGWVKPPYAEAGEEPDRERIMETRLVLSDDLGPFNLSFNWINESDLGSGRTAFGYSAGVMRMVHRQDEESASSPPDPSGSRGHTCPMHPEVKSSEPGRCPKCGMTLVLASDDEEHEHAGGVGLGLELYGALGDSRAFALEPARQEHYLGPIFMYHLSPHWMFHAQLGIGLSKTSDNLVRLNFGYEL